MGRFLRDPDLPISFFALQLIMPLLLFVSAAWGLWSFTGDYWIAPLASKKVIGTVTGSGDRLLGSGGRYPGPGRICGIQYWYKTPEGSYFGAKSGCEWSRKYSRGSTIVVYYNEIFPSFSRIKGDPGPSAFEYFVATMLTIVAFPFLVMMTFVSFKVWRGEAHTHALDE